MYSVYSLNYYSFSSIYLLCKFSIFNSNSYFMVVSKRTLSKLKFCFVEHNFVLVSWIIPELFTIYLSVRIFQAKKSLLLVSLNTNFTRKLLFR